jgi:hypothetical protein
VPHEAIQNLIRPLKVLVHERLPFFFVYKDFNGPWTNFKPYKVVEKPYKEMFLSLNDSQEAFVYKAVECQ